MNILANRTVTVHDRFFEHFREEKAQTHGKPWCEHYVAYHSGHHFSDVFTPFVRASVLSTVREYVN